MEKNTKHRVVIAETSKKLPDDVAVGHAMDKIVIKDVETGTTIIEKRG